MSDETRTPDSSDDLTAVREVLAETGAPENKTVAEQVRWLAGEVERLRPLADDGRVYRDDLITETLAEGVRALGDGFNQETYRGLLERSGIAAIKQMRTDWATIAEKRWPKGRQTVDGNDDEQPPAPRSVVPDEAYS